MSGLDTKYIFYVTVTKFVSIRVKQDMNVVVKISYFKLLVNNITPSILEEFCLEKIKSNIQMDVLFFYSLIGKTSGVKKSILQMVRKIHLLLPV